MSFRAAIALTFATCLIFLIVRSFWDFEHAMLGYTILVYGWVASKILSEGLGASIWLVIRYLLDKEKNKEEDE